MCRSVPQIPARSTASRTSSARFRRGSSTSSTAQRPEPRNTTACMMRDVTTQQNRDVSFVSSLLVSRFDHWG